MLQTPEQNQSQKQKTKTSLANPSRPQGTGFLMPANWVHHNQIVEKVLEGDYFGIRPYSAEFVATLNCSNRCKGPCSYCLQRMIEGVDRKNSFTNPEVHMQSFSFAKDMLDKLIAGGVKGITFTGGGEPFLFRHLEELVFEATKKGVDCVVYTNGNSVSEKRISRLIEASPILIRQSLNCGTEQVYNEFHKPFNTNAFSNALKSAKAFAQGALNNPKVNFGISFIVNEINKDDIPETGKRIREILDEVGGGISFLAYRPAFNYCGSKQTPPEVLDEAFNLVEDSVKPILADTKVKVNNVKCRYETLKGEEREYTKCRASGLYAELAPNGKLHVCCDRNCHRAFAIGDLKTQTFEEIFSSDQRKAVLAYADDYNCTTCPLACKPHETNKQFELIETLRNQGEMYKAEAWINAQRQKGSAVNF